MTHFDENTYRAFFQDLSGNEPYAYQVEVARKLCEGKSVLLTAPTGAGKSEAVFIPFLYGRLHGWHFPTRLVYSLPTRSLTDALADRFKSLSEKMGGSRTRVEAQHGKRPHSVLFYADAVISTIDQVVSSYVCAPLTLGVRHGNIPAGAIATSFNVFDEIHTLDPERGLQSVVLLAHRHAQMGIPFVVMTATLPHSARDILKERLGLCVVKVDEGSIPVRTEREVKLELALDRCLTPEEVEQSVAGSQGKVLVVCNTVDRAIGLARDLEGKAEVDLVLHSRYRDHHRAKHIERTHKLFGRESRGGGLVIATQVVEVGLDISCDLLLTELCPADALIQRIGRCARWATSPGTVRVFGLLGENPRQQAAPYDPDLSRSTGRYLEGLSNTARDRVSMLVEQDLVDDVLAKPYADWLCIERAGRAALKLAEAAFTGSRRSASEALREADSVAVSLHTSPNTLNEPLSRLPSINVSAGRLRRFVSEHPGSVWGVYVDEGRHSSDESKAKESLGIVKSPQDVKFGARYVLTGHVSYSEERGLTFEGDGEDWLPEEPQARTRLTDTGPKLETMERHVTRAVQCFREKVRDKELYGLRQVASWLDRPLEEIERLVLIGIICHDLGKANDAWQKAAWDTLELWLKEDSGNFERLDEEERQIVEADRQTTILARFPSLRYHKEPWKPPHATIGAYVMWNTLEGQWGNWGQAVALAMAHHHSVRSTQVLPYKLKSGWFELFQSLLKQNTGIELNASNLEFGVQGSEDKLPPPTIPPFRQEKFYTLYLVLSRCLSISDRMAAGGGEHAILDYEKWA